MSGIRACPKCGSSFVGTKCPICASQRGPAPGVFRPGENFHGLEILEVLGSGGMGIVYKAKQRDPERFVALKVCPPEKAVDPSFENRFLRESRALAGLSHPNIVRLFESGKEDGLLFYTMELVDGVTLRQLLDARRPTPRETLRIVRQICDGLACAHAAGLVHRDIKPGNILIAPDFTVKIADFGLAKVMEGDSFASTETGGALGTPHYVAPEQMENPRDVDHRADQYSTAVLLYEILTGGLPVGNWDPPSKRSGVDPRIDAVLLRALSKDPARRYPGIVEFRDALHFPLKSRVPWWPFVVAGLAVAAVALAFLYRRREKPAPQPVPAAKQERPRVAPLDPDQFYDARTLRAHGSAIHSLHWSPNGQYLASGAFKELFIWNPETGKLVQGLVPHQSWVSCVRFSPDGKLIATSSHDGDVKIFETANGLLRTTFKGHRGKVMAVAFHPGGRTIASGGLDDEIRIWDVDGGPARFTMRAPGHQIAALVYHPDGRTLYSGGWDGRIHFWNALEGKELRKIERNSDHVSSLAFTPDGASLVAGSWDGTIVLWDPASGELRKALVKTAEQYVSVSVRSGGDLLVSGDFSRVARIWSLEDGRLLRELPGHTDHVFAAAFSPDGMRVATGGADKIIKIWETTR